MGDAITGLLNLIHTTRVNDKDNEVTLGEAQEYIKGAFDTNGDGRIDAADRFDTSGNGVIDAGDDPTKIDDLRKMANADLSTVRDPILREQLKQAQAALKLALQQTSPVMPPPKIDSTNHLFRDELIRNPYDLPDVNETNRWSGVRKDFKGKEVTINRDKSKKIVTDIIDKNPSASVDEKTQKLVFELWRNEDYIAGQRRQVFRVEEMKGVLDYMNTLPGDANDPSTERGKFSASFKKSMADYINDPKNNLDPQFVMDSFIQVLQSTDFSADNESRELGQFIKDLTVGIAQNSNYFKNKTANPGTTDVVIGNYDSTKDGGIFGSLALIRKNDGTFTFVEHQTASPVNKTRYIFTGTAPPAALPPPGGAGAGSGVPPAPVPIPVPKPPVVVTPTPVPKPPVVVTPATSPNPRQAEIDKALSVLNGSPLAGKLYPGRQAYTGGYGFMSDKRTGNLYYLAPGARYWRSFSPADDAFYQANGVSGNATVTLTTPVPPKPPVVVTPTPVPKPPVVVTPKPPVVVISPKPPVTGGGPSGGSPKPPVTNQSSDVLSLEDSGDVKYPSLHSVFTNQVQTKGSRVSYPEYPPSNPSSGDLAKFVRSKRADFYRDYKYGSEYFTEIAREVARGKGNISIEDAALAADKAVNKSSIPHSPKYRLSADPNANHSEVKDFEVLFVVGTYYGDTQKTCFRLDGEVTKDAVTNTYGDKCKNFTILDDPNQAEFEKALQARAESAKRNGRKLYIFYSGHGSNIGAQAGVAARNSGKQGSREFEYGLSRFGFRVRPTETYMKNLYKKYLNGVETITIIDACYSGAAVTAIDPDEQRKYFGSLA